MYKLVYETVSIFIVLYYYTLDLLFPQELLGFYEWTLDLSNCIIHRVLQVKYQRQTTVKCYCSKKQLNQFHIHPPFNSTQSTQKGETLAVPFFSLFTLGPMWAKYPTLLYFIYFGSHVGKIPNLTVLYSLWVPCGQNTLPNCTLITLGPMWAKYPTLLYFIHFGSHVGKIPYLTVL